MTPVIGCSAYRETAHWGVWDETADLLSAPYVDAVISAGGAPVLLPADPMAVSAVDRIDGLVLTGGADVDPSSYGAPAHPSTDSPRTSRDQAERAYLDAATRRGLPVLAICRGLQILNVARGGTLIQHLPDVMTSPNHAPPDGTFLQHPVTIAADSSLARFVGRDRIIVASHHHQAVDRLGTGLRVTARADDGIVEAVEDPTYPFLVAVQWHPEVGHDLSLFSALVAAA